MPQNPDTGKIDPSYAWLTQNGPSARPTKKHSVHNVLVYVLDKDRDMHTACDNHAKHEIGYILLQRSYKNERQPKLDINNNFSHNLHLFRLIAFLGIYYETDNTQPIHS